MTLEEARPHIEQKLRELEAAAAAGDTVGSREAMEDIVDPQGFWSKNYLPYLTDDDHTRMGAAFATLQRNMDARAADAVTASGISEANATAEYSSQGTPPSTGSCPYRDYLYVGELYLHMINNSEVLSITQDLQQKKDRVARSEAEIAGIQTLTQEIIESGIAPAQVAISPVYPLEQARAELAEAEAIYPRLITAKLREAQFLFADLARGICERKPEIDQLEAKIRPFTEEALAIVNGMSETQRQAWLKNLPILSNYFDFHYSTAAIIGMSAQNSEYTAIDVSGYERLVNITRMSAFTGTMIPSDAGDLRQYYMDLRRLEGIMHSYGKVQTGFDVTTSSEFFTSFMRGAAWFLAEELAFFAAAIFTGGAIYALRAAKYISHAHDAAKMGSRARELVLAGTILPRGVRRETMRQLDDAFGYAVGKGALLQADNAADAARITHHADTATDVAAACRQGCKR